MSTYSTNPWKASVFFAFAGSQLLRRHESFSVAYHASVLLVPATFAFLYGTCRAGTNPLTLFIAYLTSLVAWTVLYRISPIHPLAKYPGPFWCKTSKLWWGLLVMRGYSHYRLRALHEQYGDVIRIGPNELSIRNRDTILPLLGTSGVPKSPAIIGGTLASGQHADDAALLALTDVGEHLRRRRPWNRALGSAALQEYVPMIARRTRQLLDGLSQQEGVVSLQGWLKYFSYDFMCDMAFGGGSELLRDGDANNIWALLEHGLAIGTFFFHLPWLGSYVGSIPGAARPLRTLMAHARTLAADRIKRGTSTRDLFHYLNNEDVPDKSPPPTKQLVDDGILAMVAGADTTASALLSIAFCLATHPEAYAKLQVEVDRFFPEGQDVLAAPDFKGMYYLNAVIHEALRLYPPSPSGGQRKVPPNASPVVVGSLVIPPGTSFWVHVYSLHRDPRNFTHPDAFWPDRWLVASGRIPLSDALPPISPLNSPSMCFSSPRSSEPDPKTFTHHESAFIPFSHGPMNCAGKHLALLELRMVVCALLQRFRIRLEEGWDLREYEKGFTDYLVAGRPEVPFVLEAR